MELRVNKVPTEGLRGAEAKRVYNQLVLQTKSANGEIEDAVINQDMKMISAIRAIYWYRRESGEMRKMG